MKTKQSVKNILNNPSALSLVYRHLALARSSLLDILSPRGHFDADMSEDFDNCMSSQQGQVGKVIDTSTGLVDRIEDAFKGVEVDDKMPSFREAHQEFCCSSRDI